MKQSIIALSYWAVSYMLNLDDIRYRFRIANFMVPAIKENFSRKYKDKPLSCPSCSDLSPMSEKPEDTQSHILTSCQAFSGLRENLDTRKDKELVEFFRKVVEIRVKEGMD